MYQEYLYYLASKLPHRDTNLAPPAMDEHIQKRIGLKPRFDRSRLCDFRGGVRRMEMVIPVIIIDVSRIPLLRRFIIVIHRHKLASISNI